MTDLVQPIVLLVDRTDPAAHADAVTAVAVASVTAHLEALAADAGPEPAWNQWLSGRFTKTVRRADAKTLAKLAADPGLPRGAEARVGSAVAVAYSPTTYEAMPKRLSRLQVSGTELPELPAAERPSHSGDPVVVLNSALGMSTGKAAAQAAHALFAWHLGRGGQDRDLEAVRVRRASLVIASAEQFAGLRDLAAAPLIVDAGLTEIAPGTATAYTIERP